MFQSLGMKNKNYGKWIDCGAKAVAILIFLDIFPSLLLCSRTVK